MSILGDLSNATKALNAHRFGVTTAGTNIANVNNPEYSRQRVILGDRGVVQSGVGVQGLGVEVIGFTQIRDQILDREILRETSVNSSLEAQSSALRKAEASMGQEIDRTGDSAFIDGVANDGAGSGGLAEVLNDYFNAFHALSANPLPLRKRNRFFRSLRFWFKSCTSPRSVLMISRRISPLRRKRI